MSQPPDTNPRKMDPSMQPLADILEDVLSHVLDDGVVVDDRVVDGRVVDGRTVAGRRVGDERTDAGDRGSGAAGGGAAATAERRPGERKRHRPGAGVRRPTAIGLRVLADWERIAPPPWPDVGKPVRLEDGELVVAVGDGATATLLRFRIGELRASINQSVGAEVVTTVRVVVERRT